MKFGRGAIAVSLALSLGLFATAATPAPAVAETSAEIQERVNEAYATLMSYTSELELASNQLQAVKDELVAVQDEIEKTQQEIEKKEQEIDRGQELISERLSAAYKGGNASLLSVILGASDFDELFRGIFYANKVADYDAELVAQVKAARDELERQEQQLAEQQEEKQQLVTEQEAKTVELSERLAQQQDYYNSLDAELQAKLAEEEAIRIAQEEAERRAAEEAARREQEEQERQEQEQQEQNQGQSQGGSSSAGGSSGTGGSTSSGNSGSGSAGGSSGTGGSSSGSGGGSSNSGGGSSSGGSSSKPSDNGNTNSGNAPSSVVSVALAQVGKPYIFSTEGPDSFDCSGLVVYSYAQVGYSLPHSSQAQYNLVRNKGHLVYSVSNLKPGDLVFWGSGGSGSAIYHVGIYIGGGRYVHASMPGVGVVTATLSTGGNFVGGGSPV